MSFMLEMFLNEVNLDVLPEVESFWYDETIYGASPFHLHVSTSDWSKWDKIVTDPNSQEAKIRWGLLDDTIERWAPWKEVLLTPAHFSYAYNILDLTIDGVDSGYKLREVTHSLAFVNQRISEMVEAIAAANKLNSDIEETQGLFTLYQGTQSDAEFIQEVLLAHALSNSGRSDYVFYIRDGKELVFEPVDLSRVYATYPVRSEATEATEGDIDALAVDLRRLFRAPESSYSTEIRGFDGYKKEPVHRTIDEDSAELPYMARNRPAAPGTVSTIQLTPHGEIDLVLSEGRATWGRNARKLFRTAVETGYDVEVRPGAVVALTSFTPEKEVHWTNGRWIVYKVRQWFRPKGFGTTLFLERRAYG